ncbi:MAG: hypothetical protein KGQ89_03625 [Verrucomicrobia bacterium]|nr:hypothetical protein [Verrucomicrobiota bacterium]
MKQLLIPMFIACSMLCSCKKVPLVVTSTETRERSTKDGPVKLNASSDERFRDSQPSPLQGDAPSNWLSRPASQFRLLNFAFGSSGTGEVYVSKSQGSVLDNVNRWMKQFAQPNLDDAGMEKLEKIALLGTEAVWVSAEGTYAGGMGKEPVEGFSLAGVVGRVGNDIYTVKMVGPKEEVAAEKEKLQAYVKSLRMAE